MMRTDHESSNTVLNFPSFHVKYRAHAHDNHSPHRMAQSKFVMQRIPGNFTQEAIDAAIDNVPREAVDEIVSSYLFD